MDEHVNSINEAYQKFIDASTVVLTEYNSVGCVRTEAAALAMAKLKEQHEHLHLACDHAEGFADMMTKQVKELEVAHHTNVMNPNAAKLVPVRPAYARPVLKRQKELESDARYGDVADAPEEHDTAASQASAGHNLISN